MPLPCIHSGPKAFIRAQITPTLASVSYLAPLGSKHPISKTRRPILGSKRLLGGVQTPPLRVQMFHPRFKCSRGGSDARFGV